MREKRCSVRRLSKLYGPVAGGRSGTDALLRGEISFSPPVNAIFLNIFWKASRICRVPDADLGNFKRQSRSRPSCPGAVAKIPELKVHRA